MKAIIAAAGIGSRLLPVTAGIPKSLIPILNKPIIHYLVEQCAKAGVKEIIIVTNRDGYLIQKYFSSKEEAKYILEQKGLEGDIDDYWGIPEDLQFIYIRQDIELPHGNASPLYSARHLIDGDPFLYLFDDVYIMGNHAGVEELIRKFEEDSCDGVMTGMKYEKKELKKKAVVKIRKGTNDEIESIIEKPTPGKEPSNIGTVSPYIFSSKLISYLDPKDINTRVGEFVFQDGVEKMLRDGGRVKVKLSNGIYLSNGDPLSYFKAVVEQSLFDPKLKEEALEFLRRRIDNER